MYHLKLLEIARLVGLTQADIARHLDISICPGDALGEGHTAAPTQAPGRPLAPRLYGTGNVCRVGEGRCMACGGIDAGDPGKPPFRQQLEALLDELSVAYLEIRDEGPSTWIASTLVALDALPQRFESAPQTRVRREDDRART